MHKYRIQQNNQELCELCGLNNRHAFEFNFCVFFEVGKQLLHNCLNYISTPTDI